MYHPISFLKFKAGRNGNNHLQSIENNLVLKMNHPHGGVESLNPFKLLKNHNLESLNDFH